MIEVFRSRAEEVSVKWKKDMTIESLLRELGDDYQYAGVVIDFDPFVPNLEFGLTQIPKYTKQIRFIPQIAGG